jgi:NarL family two-component system response regulator YdfI
VSEPLAPVVRVLVVAPSPVVRAGLEALLAADPAVRVVGAATPGPRVADVVARDRPDVILMDRDPAAALATEWLSDAPEPDPTPVVLLADLDDDAAGASGLDALRRGASAVLARGASASAIAAAVRAAAAGLVVVERAALDGVLGAVHSTTGASAAHEHVDDDAPPLTPRELEVLAMLAEGLGNKRIAARLAISEHTVKFHLASVYAKLRVSTRTEAVTAGVRRGLVML